MGWSGTSWAWGLDEPGLSGKEPMICIDYLFGVRRDLVLDGPRYVHRAQGTRAYGARACTVGGLGVTASGPSQARRQRG